MKRGKQIESKWGKVILITNHGVLAGKKESEDTRFVRKSENWQHK